MLAVVCYQFSNFRPYFMCCPFKICFQVVVLAVTAKDRGSMRDYRRQTGRRDLTIIDVEVGTCSVIEENIKQGFLPDKMLYNIGLDAASTDLVCVSPSDVVFRLSDAGVFAGQLAVGEMKEKRKNTEVEKKGEEETEEEGGEVFHAPKALIVPVYYPRTHQRNQNSTESKSSKTLKGQHSDKGKDTMRQENISPSKADSQSVAATVTAGQRGHPIPFPSPTAPCGEQQSSKLMKAYIGPSDQQNLDDPEGLIKVSFNAKVVPLYSFLLFVSV